MTTKDTVRQQILLGALQHIPFDGWNRHALLAGASDKGIGAGEMDRVFPGGAIDAIDYFNEWADRNMVAALNDRNLPAMKVRERIAAAVRTRLEQNAEYREAIRRALAVLALPHNAPRATRILYRTVNEMWYAAGDTATDHNFYTKRGLLAGVYASTVLYWLNDRSSDFSATWNFLDRRIDEVMRVPQKLSRITRVVGRFPDPFRLAAGFRDRGFRRPRPDIYR